MPPKVNTDRREEPMNDWAELRRTLLAMQENLQATIHDSIHELVETVLHRREQHRGSQGNDSENDEDNPFAGEFHRRRWGGAWRGIERDDRRWEAGLKLDIPEFHGGAKGEELLDWLVAVEELLEFEQVREDQKVPLVATKFRGKAASWWMQLKTTRSRLGKERIKSWAKLKRALKKSFLPYNFDRTMFTRLQNLRQGSHSVDEYAEEFSLLLTQTEIYDSEVQLVSRFIGRLRPQLQSAMAQFNLDTISEAHR